MHLSYSCSSERLKCLEEEEFPIISGLVGYWVDCLTTDGWRFTNVTLEVAESGNLQY